MIYLSKYDGFETGITRRVPHVEQKLPTLPVLVECVLLDL